MNKYKQLISIILAATFFFSVFGYAPAAKAVDSPVIDEDDVAFSTASIKDDFADNRVLVLLSPEASKRKAAYSAADFHELGSVKVENITAEMYNYLVQQQTFNGDSHSKRNKNFKHILCIELATPGKENVLNAIKVLLERNDVLYAGPDYVIQATSTLNNPPVNDDEYHNQWAISNIDLDDAWNLTTGSNSVMVGVLDSGIDTSHEDLVGVVNATLSADFTGSGGATTDIYGHGTKVAGVIGAKTNNEDGIAGVCWNVKLVSLKVISNYGQGYSSYVYRAIAYATTKNIPILNLSSAWPESEVGNGRYNQILDTILLNYPGLFVCSAGNDKNNNDSYGYYPSNSALSNVISVTASTQNNTIWADLNDPTQGSNYGSWSVDLFAPGDMIVTTFVGGIYANEDGTSMAAPFVAGIAALILSYHNDPTGEVFTGSVLKNILMNSVDVYSAFTGKCVTNGKINAYKAVTSDLAHKYTFSQYSMLKHKCSCACGDYYYENHDWNDAGTACEDCGFYPMGDV